MQDLNCKTARLWIQAPDELASLDVRHLNRHLQECDRCAGYRRRSVEIDRLIDTSLARRTEAVSVRAAVWDRIERMEATSSSRRRRFWPRFGRRPTRRTVLVPAVLALVAAISAAIVPQLTPHSGPGNLITAAPYWNPNRAYIGFPMTVDPSNGRHLLAGAFGQVYESWNAGGSWKQLGGIGPRQVVRDIAIDSTDPRRYLVATLLSVLRSNDGGQHWETAVSGLRGAMNMFLMQDPNDPATFYVGPSVLWKSSQHGAPQTWRIAGTNVFAPYGIQALAERKGTLYTGVWGNGVAVSHDEGATWQVRSSGLAPHVMSVAPGPGRLLAGTDKGLYRSTDGGLTWKKSGPGVRFFTTSVFDGGSYQLAGGQGGVFRSTDGGKHWTISVDGLPLYSYVYDFVADPHHPNRVYASLDSDGLFRSDDGGQHWQSVNNGLPIAGHESMGQKLLFSRQGVLWQTDDLGTDPRNLTVDNQIVVGAMSPDGAAAVYVNGSTGGWAARLVGAGGSRAVTIASGTGPVPHGVTWSADSTLIAVASGRTVYVSNTGGHGHSWQTPVGDRLIGWTSGGRHLLFWNKSTHVLIERAWDTGAVTGHSPATVLAAPILASDGTRVAFAHAGKLYIGPWQSGTQATGSIDPTCRLAGWSGTGARLLAVCKSGVQELLPNGAVVGHAVLPSTVFWAPGSDSEVLFYRSGSLWRWVPGRQAAIVVRHAHTVQPELASLPAPRS